MTIFTFQANIGQNEEFEKARKKALALGAKKVTGMQRVLLGHGLAWVGLLKWPHLQDRCKGYGGTVQKSSRSLSTIVAVATDQRERERALPKYWEDQGRAHERGLEGLNCMQAQEMPRTYWSS